jgi:hypothetical protein
MSLSGARTKADSKHKKNLKRNSIKINEMKSTTRKSRRTETASGKATTQSGITGERTKQGKMLQKEEKGTDTKKQQKQQRKRYQCDF